MKKLFNLPRWFILAIVVFLYLVFAKVVFPVETKIPREVMQCVKYLARDDYDSFAKLCADTVLFGQAFSEGIEMTKRELIRFLKRHDLSRENRDLFRKFPKGFKINRDRKKRELICYRFSKPSAWFVFKQEEKTWKLKVLGIHFSETKEDK